MFVFRLASALALASYNFFILLLFRRRHNLLWDVIRVTLLIKAILPILSILVMIIFIFYSLIICLNILLTNLQNIFGSDHFFISFFSFFRFFNFFIFLGETLAFADGLVAAPAEIFSADMAIVRLRLISIDSVS